MVSVSWRTQNTPHPTFSWRRLCLHSFMRSSQAESIIAAVSWLALRRRRPTSCNVYSTRQHESSRTRASSTGYSTHFRRSQLHWLDVVDRVRFRVCVQVFRCLHKMAPEYLSSVDLYCQPVSGSLSLSSFKRSKPFSSLSTRLAHAASLGFFSQKRAI